MRSHSEITLAVCEVAKNAGAFISSEALKFSSDKIEYKGLNDMVSYVDKTAESLIVLELRKILPQAGFITEEGTASERAAEYNWIIDPLDGTTNFIHGIPAYAVSIGLMKGNQIISGVVYEVNRKECFYATKGEGAFLNGNKIFVSKEGSISGSLIATGFPYTVFKELENYLAVLTEFMKTSHGIRRIGSAAVDLAYVACGRFSAFYEYNLNAWDVAGGSLIVEEAGGKVTDFKDGDDFVFGREILASNKLIHHEALTVIRKHFQ